MILWSWIRKELLLRDLDRQNIDLYTLNAKLIEQNRYKRKFSIYSRLKLRKKELYKKIEDTTSKLNQIYLHDNA